MYREHELDFEIVREPWNRYSLKDGSYVKSRYILTKVKRMEPTQRGEKHSYGAEGQTVTVITNVPENLKGPPSTRAYSPEELSSSIVVDEVEYNILSEEWNEYVVEDGTKIRIKDTVTKVSRTNKCDQGGNPVYIVQHSTLVGVKPGKT